MLKNLGLRPRFSTPSSEPSECKFTEKHVCTAMRRLIRDFVRRSYFAWHQGTTFPTILHMRLAKTHMRTLISLCSRQTVHSLGSWTSLSRQLLRSDCADAHMWNCRKCCDSYYGLLMKKIDDPYFFMSELWPPFLTCLFENEHRWHANPAQECSL